MACNNKLTFNQALAIQKAHVNGYSKGLTLEQEKEFKAQVARLTAKAPFRVVDPAYNRHSQLRYIFKFSDKDTLFVPLDAKVDVPTYTDQDSMPVRVIDKLVPRGTRLEKIAQEIRGE